MIKFFLGFIIGLYVAEYYNYTFSSLIGFIDKIFK